MLLSVFGSQLASGTQVVGSFPLPVSLAGASATVNGVAAPFYYASPSQLNIQIPYETGIGPAVLGVNNSGQVASYVFTVAASAPGIFTLGRAVNKMVRRRRRPERAAPPHGGWMRMLSKFRFQATSRELNICRFVGC
jgi:uncharacterized protein (TIGR03437 family)